MKRIQAPDGGILEFPETMSDDAILGVMRKQFGGPEAPQAEGGVMSKIGQGFSNLGKAADDMARIGANAMTFGYADKLAGYLGGKGTEAERAQTQGAKERADWAGTVAEISGGLATGHGLASAGLTTARMVPQGLKGLAGLGARTAAMGVEGAGYGALNALGNDQDVRTGALVGAGAGALGNIAGEGLSKALGATARAFNKQPVLPTPDKIRAAKDAAYKQVEQADVIYTPQALSRLKNDVEDFLGRKAYDPGLQPRVAPSLKDIAAKAEGGENITLQGLDVIRLKASDAFDPMNKKSG